jgi:hypothetical protein
MSKVSGRLFLIRKAEVHDDGTMTIYAAKEDGLEFCVSNAEIVETSNIGIYSASPQTTATLTGRGQINSK